MNGGPVNVVDLDKMREVVRNLFMLTSHSLLGIMRASSHYFPLVNIYYDVLISVADIHYRTLRIYPSLYPM
jgi:hypothetical protein